MNLKDLSDVLNAKNYIIEIKDQKIFIKDKFTDVKRLYKFCDFNFVLYIVDNSVNIVSNYKKDSDFKVETYVQSYIKTLSKTLKQKIYFSYYAKDKLIYQKTIENF